MCMHVRIGLELSLATLTCTVAVAYQLCMAMHSLNNCNLVKSWKAQRKCCPITNNGEVLEGI